MLHEMSWKEISEIDKEKTIFILPTGSTEQHGPQNPLGTDFLIAETKLLEARLALLSFVLHMLLNHIF